MGESIRLNRVESRFAELDYPVTREEAVERYEDVTVLLADGEENLGDLLANLSEDRFDSPEELYSELQNALPVEAVGEPGQSEGDG